MLEPGPFECAACGSAPVRLQPAGQLRFARCSSCGHAAVAAAGGPGVPSYDEGYDGFQADPTFATFARSFVREHIRPRFGGAARVLDVGCGNGEFLLALREAGLSGVGWDVSEAAMAIARGRGLTVVAGDLESLPAEDFDLVTMWDVIEHVTAPRLLVRAARKALRPGGRLLVKTPAIAPAMIEVCARVPRSVGAFLAVPAHIQFFQSSSLAELLEREGMRLEQTFPVGATRAPSRGGGIAKRLKRGLARVVPRMMGCATLLVLARRSPS